LAISYLACEKVYFFSFPCTCLLIAFSGSHSYIGTSLKQASLRSQTGALVLAIRRADGDVIAGPDGNTEILQGDVLISMGTPEQLRALNQLLSPISKKQNILRLPRTK
jgi:voltage-gated potassium channel